MATGSLTGAWKHKTVTGPFFIEVYKRLSGKCFKILKITIYKNIYKLKVTIIKIAKKHIYLKCDVCKM